MTSNISLFNGPSDVPSELPYELTNLHNIIHDKPIVLFEEAINNEPINSVLPYSSTNKEQRHSTYMLVFKLLTSVFKQSVVDVKKQCIKALIILSSEYLDVLADRPDHAASLNKKIIELITIYKMRELIPIYNAIYTIKYVDNEPSVLEITPEQADSILSSWVMPAVRLVAKPKYAIGEIVGAKDKENNWWMAKILYSTQHLAHVIYYVEFLNWGEQFNEFITDCSRLQRFNAYKHKYYRTASEHAAIYAEDE